MQIIYKANCILIKFDDIDTAEDFKVLILGLKAKGIYSKKAKFYINGKGPYKLSDS